MQPWLRWAASDDTKGGYNVGGIVASHFGGVAGENDPKRTELIPVTTY